MTSIIKVDTFQDTGGNALFSSDGSGTVTLDSNFSGVLPSNTPAFKVNHTGGDQQISNDVMTKIDYDNVVFDTNSAFDTSTDRFTVPSGQAGKYYFHATGSFNTESDFDRVVIQIHKNGSAVSELRKRNFYYDHIKTSIILDLSVGDYMEVYALQSSGGTVAYRNSTVDNYFMGYKLIGA